MLMAELADEVVSTSTASKWPASLLRRFAVLADLSGSSCSLEVLKLLVLKDYIRRLGGGMRERVTL